MDKYRELVSKSKGSRRRKFSIKKQRNFKQLLYLEGSEDETRNYSVENKVGKHLRKMHNQIV